MSKSCCLYLLLTVLFLIPVDAPLHASPLPPLGPADITGTVVEVKWFPRREMKGIAGMSGTAGIDRVFPAHFLVALQPYEGVSGDTATLMTEYVHPPSGQHPSSAGPLFINIAHDDADLLKTGMKIQVRGYEVRGDEGGTWTKYQDITVISESSKDELQQREESVQRMGRPRPFPICREERL